MGLTLGYMSSEIHFGDHDDHGHGDDHGDHDDHDGHEGHADHGQKAHAPNWNYSLSFNYNFTQDSSLMIEIAGKDGFVFDSALEEYESDPYHLLNAFYSHTFNQLKLGVYAKNVLDESYADRGFIFGLEPPMYEEKLYKSFAPPREIGLSLSYSF